MTKFSEQEIAKLLHAPRQKPVEVTDCVALKAAIEKAVEQKLELDILAHFDEIVFYLDAEDNEFLHYSFKNVQKSQYELQDSGFLRLLKSGF
ncbi:hypothetical protein [Bacillus ndiopicus]|uniref:hypothetical protein n=1 Tax=Bacillus ndiopicus TaxID=1347368 RepID=UPI0005A74440|nr:hypothetical protein [Bacillus ndiopicus]